MEKKANKLLSDLSKTTLEPSYKPHYRKDDLKYFIRDFVEEQKRLLEIEKQEEETQTLNNISMFYTKDLEKMGVCVRKLDLIETVFESYGKFLTQFQKRTTKDMANKLARYKFSSGDTVGLFEYSDKVHNEVLHQGVVVEFNEKKIVVAFDKEITGEDLPKNICLVQLSNQVTYERIRDGLERLENNEINEDSMTLVQTLFGIRDPSFRDEFKQEDEKEKLYFLNANLNNSQKEAVRFCLEANELALIHGPPGTGKTTTVCELILQGVTLGMKILVVAPSNIAVDNIAEKLIPYRKQLNFDLCRIGHPARILTPVVQISLDAKLEKSPNMKFVKDIKREIEKKRKELNKTEKSKKEERRNLKSELRSLREDIKGSYRNTVIDIYSKNKVILATCIGAGDYNLKESLSKYNAGTFDLVVIDECAQGTEALCWISILLGKKLVLAGDHLQLPPTIKSKAAEKGLSFTLFDRMIKKHEGCAKLLNIQYRMNESIMNFSSHALYDGKLIADESVKSHKVIDMLKKKNKTDSFSNNDNDIDNDANNENDNDIHNDSFNDKLNILDKNLVMINTNGFEFHESVDVDSTSKFNIGEAKICKFFIDYLKINYVDLAAIGIITPYSAQVNMLKSLLPMDEYKDLEISTVDGFQGREKEIIILSLVRSNKKREVGFLADYRRLNVAITRARRMVALICDESTVSNHAFLKKMCDYFSEKAFEVGLMENIMDFKEIEDTKYESMKSKDKDEKTKNKEISKDNTIDGNGKAAKKKKNKQNKLDKNADKNSSMQSVSSGVNIYGDHKSNNYNNNQNQNQSQGHKKEEVNLEFINKIQKLIEHFINSKEDEYKIEGLDNSERRYIHCYAEIKHLIHESQGENEKRILILRKNNKNTKTAENENENLKIITEDIVDYMIDNKTENISEKKEIKVNIQQNKTKMVNTQNTKTTHSHIVGSTIDIQPIKPVTASHKIKLETNWDEIDNLLDQYQNQDKNKCNFENCKFSSKIPNSNTKCQFCDFYFCNIHLRGVVHECVIYNKPDVNYTQKYMSNKVNTKINEMEEKRNKKAPQKKKK